MCDPEMYKAVALLVVVLTTTKPLSQWRSADYWQHTIPCRDPAKIEPVTLSSGKVLRAHQVRSC